MLLVALGTALIPWMHTTLGLILAIGRWPPAAPAWPGLGADGRHHAPGGARKAWIATGIVNAGGSFGQFIFAPIAQGITAAAGWVVALQSLAALMLLALPAAVGAPAAARCVGRERDGRRRRHRAAVRRALADRSYRRRPASSSAASSAGLPGHAPAGVVASAPTFPLPEVGAWSLAMIGLFNIVGKLCIGWAIGHRNGRWPMKRLLTLIYASRALAVLLFVLAPKSTGGVMLAFAAVMGLTFLSTVPPTAGLVARFFGPAHMGTLFGLVMVTHQVGGFLGAYLGGKAFELTGRYDWMWWADIVLALAAALLHWPIREPRPAEAAAARAA